MNCVSLCLLEGALECPLIRCVPSAFFEPETLGVDKKYFHNSKWDDCWCAVV